MGKVMCEYCKSEQETKENRTQVRCGRCGNFIRLISDKDNERIDQILNMYENLNYKLILNSKYKESRDPLLKIAEERQKLYEDQNC